MDDPLDTSDSTRKNSVFIKKEETINSLCRQLVANVTEFMKSEAELYKTTMQIIIPIINHKERVLAATGLSAETYSRIMNEPEEIITTSSGSRRRGRKRKHKDCEVIAEEQVDHTVESESNFRIKEEKGPELTVEELPLIADIKEEIKCVTPEIVYVPSFQTEEERVPSVNNEMDSDIKYSTFDTGIPPPSNTVDATSPATFDSLPQMSKGRYENAYKRFMDYLQEKETETCSEKVVMQYFVDLSTKVKASSLWAIYSMLRTTLIVRDSVDIANYPKLRSFLRRQARGYQAKKSKILTGEQVQRFILEAPDDEFLTIKVALIFGIAGACRRDELFRICIDDIQDLGSKLLITVPDKNPRSFIVNRTYLGKYRKYIASRPKNFINTRFFYKFKNGTGSKQVVGKNQFGKMPQLIAKYLNLPNTKDYTGHCFRNSSAAVLANTYF